MTDVIVTGEAVDGQDFGPQRQATVASHGCMLVIEAQSLAVLHASANTREMLGLAPEALQRGGLEAVLGKRVEAVVSGLASGASGHGRMLLACLSAEQHPGRCPLNLFARRYGSVLILEFEAVPAEVPALSGAMAPLISVPARDGDGSLAPFFGLDERTQAEAELERSERMLQSAIEVAGLEPYEWNAAAGTFDWRPRLKAWWGLPPDAHVDDDVFFAGVHPEDRAALQEKVMKALDPEGDGVVEAEYRVIGRDTGVERWILTRGRTVFDAARRPVRFVGAAQDVTERRRAEQRLRDSERRHAFLLKLTDALQSTLDPLEIEAVACRLLAEELGAHRAYFCAVDEAAGALRVARDYCRDSSASLVGEHRVADFAWSLTTLRRGECLVIADTQSSALVPPADRAACAAVQVIACADAPLLAGGRLVGALCVSEARPREWLDSEIDILREVLDRVWAALQYARSEAALRENERRLQLAYDAAEIGAWDADLVHARSVWTPRLYDMLGVDHDCEPSAQLFFEHVHPDDAARLREGFARSVASRSLFNEEFRIRRGDGEIRHIVGVGRVIEEADGAPKRMIGVNYDITSRKEIEEKLRDSQRRLSFVLRLSDRMRPLSEPGAIRAEAVRALAEELDVARTVFYEIDDGDYVIPSECARGVVALSGRYPVASFGTRLLERQSLDAPEVVSDVARVHSDAEVAKFSEIQIGAYLNVPLVKNGRFVAGLSAHAPAPRNWTPTEVALVQDVAERTWAAVEQARAEAALRQAHNTFRHLVDHSPFGIYTVDADFRIAQVSDGARKVFANVQPLIGRDLAEALRIVWDEPFATEVIGRFRHTLATGEPYRSPSTVEKRADLAVKEAYDWKIERIGLPDGRPGIVCHFYDLSERQRQEEHIQLLMREVNHRAKNILSLVQAIARQTTAADAEDFLDRFEERVQALAANQDLLVKNDWKAVPLHDLVNSQLAHFQDSKGARVAVDGPPVEVTASASQALGMAIHELATNAAKYGALSNEAGRVNIAWTTEPGDAPRFAISWTESGGPLVDNPRRRGFGSTVIGAMVEMSLGSRAEIRYEPSGLVWRISCPAGNVIAGDGARPAEWTQGAVAGPAAATSGRRHVLVVEDDGLIAMEIAGALSAAGWEVVGPASTVAQALSLIAERGCDAAVLDNNLGPETAQPVAAELVRSGTPFVTVSGYSRWQLPPVMQGAPLIGKPLDRRLLVAKISRCLN